MASRSIKLSTIKFFAAPLLVFGFVFASHATVQSWDWSITEPNPVSSSYHYANNVGFSSLHTVTLKRTYNGTDDYATVWAKNGYQETGSSAVEVGNATDNVSWTGSGNYDWTSNTMTPSGNKIFGSPTRTVGVWWKSQVQLNGGSIVLATKNGTGQSAFYSGSITIIP